MTENRKKREMAKYSLKQQMRFALNQESVNFAGQPYARTICARLCVVAESKDIFAPIAALAIAAILNCEQ